VLQLSGYVGLFLAVMLILHSVAESSVPTGDAAGRGWAIDRITETSPCRKMRWAWLLSPIQSAFYVSRYVRLAPQAQWVVATLLVDDPFRGHHI
jgi:hypothetical protein